MRYQLGRPAAAMSTALLGAALLVACSTSEASPGRSVGPPPSATRSTTTPAPEPAIPKPAHERGSPGGWFYLMFTDTSRRAGVDGVGQFLLRARDPAFTSGVEARFNSIAHAFSADLMWVDALAMFAIAYESPEGTTILFWDKDFRANPLPPVHLSGPHREGPGLVRRADGHAVVPPDDPCETVPLDLIRGSREGPHGPTDLVHAGVDLVGAGACRTTATALAVLDGFAVPSPRRTVDLVLSGQLIRVERRSVAETLAVRVLERRPRALEKVPVVMEIPAGVAARRAEGRGVGLIVDAQLVRVPSAAVAERNSSAILDISPAAWDHYERGPDVLPPAR